MNIKIRRGAFETNSSSEHTLILVKTCLLNDWKSGKMVARLDQVHADTKRATGNFDSDCLSLVFASAEFDDSTFEVDWKAQNEELLKKKIADTKALYEDRRKRLLESLNDPEFKEIYPNWTEDDINKSYDEELANLDKDAEWLFEHEFSKLYDGFWMTWEDFEHEMFGFDCISGFEHEDPMLGITAIGKYNHT